MGRGPRSQERITRRDLAKLAAIAAADREARFARKPRWRPYADRILCVALCQGAALHYVDGVNGINDVYTFYAEHRVGQFPARWLLNADFGPSRFGRNAEYDHVYEGRRVDLIGRSLKAKPNADPIKVLRAYLQAGQTETARCLARKAVVLIGPEPLRGRVVWPRRLGET